MRAVVQRVTHADVTVSGKQVGTINKGLCILLGVMEDDTEKDAVWLAEKLSVMRIFEDENEKLNLSVQDINGSMLVISQFTLYGDCRKGRRPSFIRAAGPEKASRLYDLFVDQLRSRDIKVETGIFQTYMQVNICNDGPVTLIVDTPESD